MAEVVRYALDDGSVVLFEVEPLDGFAEASAEQVVGRVREAVGLAARAAREVLDQVKAHGPREVEVKFGIKVSGKMFSPAAGPAADRHHRSPSGLVALRTCGGGGAPRPPLVTPSDPLQHVNLLLFRRGRE